MTRTTKRKKKSKITDDALAPRLPWDVGQSTGPAPTRDDAEARQKTEEKAAAFAQAGKIDILSKIHGLREEIERLHLQKNTSSDREKELELETSALREQAERAEESLVAIEEERAGWAEERDTLRSQMSDMRRRMREAETDRNRLKAQLDVSQATVAEITEALQWREEDATSPPTE